MVALPEKVIENINTWKGRARGVLATVSDAGVPNVVPVGAVMVKDPETILIGDNFFKKTAENVMRPNCRALATRQLLTVASQNASRRNCDDSFCNASVR
jgi:predicted pyridoxine 5'-phosphate oxidase superfamily flavin-nucleotide-binding protein